MRTVRVGLVQVRVDGDVGVRLPARLAHLDALVAGVRPGELDLLCFPEACASPYLFADAADARRRAEPAEQAAGAVDFFRRLAVRLCCGVAAGLITLRGDAAPSARPRNVFVVVSPAGEVRVTRSKNLLYATDKRWADEPRPDEAFAVVRLPWLGDVRAMFAVCNDINSRDESDFEAYPLASAAARDRAQLVVLLTAWCSQGPTATAAEHDAAVEVDDQLDYWFARLRPLWGSGAHLVAADRVGREPVPGAKDGARVHYCGSSCAVRLGTTARVLGVLDAESEGVLRVQLEV